MRAAVVDLGTNSFLLLVGERDQQGQLTIIEEALFEPRLGQGLDRTGAISAEAEARATEAVLQIGNRCRELGAEIHAVGTEVFRRAKNGSTVAETLAGVLGASITILSGEEEARYAHLGSAWQLYPVGYPYLHVDIGGGSTEITSGLAGSLPKVSSLPYGCVLLQERYLHTDPPTPGEMLRLLGKIAREFGGAKRLVESPTWPLVAGGGTATYLAAVHLGLTDYDPKRIHGLVLSEHILWELVLRLAELPLDSRRALPGLTASRAEVIVAGGLVLLSVMSILERDQVIVSAQGLRMGVLLECLAPRGE